MPKGQYGRRAVSAAPQGPAMDDDDAALMEDDAALGIGQEDEAPVAAFAPAPVPETVAGLDVAALLANPDFAKLVDAVVASRMGAAQPARMAAPDGAAGIGTAEWRELMDKLGRQFDAQQEQKPGYVKPWTAQEIAARARGLSDLKAILADYRARGIWPTYLLGEDFYGTSVNGLKTHKAGHKIKTLVFPAESFQPCDQAAATVYEAYKRWVGEVHDISDLIATAMMTARGNEAPDLVRAGPALAQSDVIEVEDEVVDMSPARTMGSLVPEPRTVGKRMASGAPVGPEYVDG